MYPSVIVRSWKLETTFPKNIPTQAAPSLPFQIEREPQSFQVVTESKASKGIISQRKPNKIGLLSFLIPRFSGAVFASGSPPLHRNF